MTRALDIIIPCWNGARYLGRTLDAALAQTYEPKRILVVDDGSTDSSAEVVRSYGDRVGYVFQENGGQASARNLGIARTDGEYVCLLDADDLLAPEMAARLIARLEAHPEADFAHSQVLAFSGDDVGRPYTESWRPNVAWESYLAPLSIHCAIHGSSTLFRRRTFERYGHFPEARSLQGCEDWHFWLQAVLGGAVIEHVPEVLCLYRQHPASSSASERSIAKRESELMRAAAAMFERHGIEDERSRALLAVGMASIAGRWLTLRERTQFHDLYERAKSLAPAALRARHFESFRPDDRTSHPELLHLRLTEVLLELDCEDLAAAMFLRCRDARQMRKWAARQGRLDAFERVRAALTALLDANGREGERSYLSHLAFQLGLLDRTPGDPEAGRARFDQALALDPNQVRALAELAILDLRRGRIGDALERWRRCSAQDPGLMMFELAKRGLWSGLRRVGLFEPVQSMLHRNPETHERLRSAAKSALRILPGSRRS